jgi:arginyl-tRNA synthetase
MIGYNGKMNLLEQQNSEVAEKIAQTKAAVLGRRREEGYVSLSRYLLPILAEAIGFPDAKLEFIDRAQFGADVALTVPALLKESGAKEYIAQHVPQIVAQIEEHSKKIEGGWIEKVEAKGIYINLRLADAFLFGTVVSAVQKLDLKYGESDIAQDKNIVVDYSSPNVAKHLHAGHIRSTIIGEVLSNIYEAVGYTAHRVNFIEDWGGFGNLLEAHARWGNREGEFETKNEYLYFLYTSYRALEKEAEATDGAGFAEFKESAALRFRRLEAGEAAETELWEKMVAWSLAEFQHFYDLIDIHPDYTIGGSFHVRRGGEIVTEGLAKETAALEDGAAVVHVGGETDFVIRRADESTIYATRDLAAIEYRVKEFSAGRMVYVVGQEQTDYFAKLFKAADILGLAPKGTVLQHVPFGFYVSLATKKKLSSREGATSVIALIQSAIDYFAQKYPDLSAEDIKKIAIGSITFNDIKKNRMMAVELDTGNAQNIIRSFEESGAAYVMYAVARARSIMRKAGGEVANASDLDLKHLSLQPIELVLLKRLASLSETISRAAQMNEPSVLAEYLLRVAQEYNSYYESHHVLTKEGTVEFPHRLALTSAVAQVLVNGLKLCHVDVPEKM